MVDSKENKKFDLRVKGLQYIDSMLPWDCSVILAQMTSKCGKKSEIHLTAPHVPTFVFSTVWHFI